MKYIEFDLAKGLLTLKHDFIRPMLLRLRGIHNPPNSRTYFFGIGPMSNVSDLT